MYGQDQNVAIAPVLYPASGLSGVPLDAPMLYPASGLSGVPLGAPVLYPASGLSGVPLGAPMLYSASGLLCIHPYKPRKVPRESERIMQCSNTALVPHLVTGFAGAFIEAPVFFECLLEQLTLACLVPTAGQMRSKMPAMINSNNRAPVCAIIL
eukprot:1145298-Pelagomonas_calceolata.AAC.2